MVHHRCYGALTAHSEGPGIGWQANIVAPCDNGLQLPRHGRIHSALAGCLDVSRIPSTYSGSHAWLLSRASPSSAPAMVSPQNPGSGLNIPPSTTASAER